MIGTGHYCPAPPLVNGIIYPLIIRGYPDFINRFGLETLLVDVPDHRISLDQDKRFPRKTGGAKAGGNNDDIQGYSLTIRRLVATFPVD
jgi:hypothetical protein